MSASVLSVSAVALSSALVVSQTVSAAGQACWRPENLRTLQVNSCLNQEGIYDFSQLTLFGECYQNVAGARIGTWEGFEAPVAISTTIGPPDGTDTLVLDIVPGLIDPADYRVELLDPFGKRLETLLVSIDDESDAGCTGAAPL
jgi:hypothetical protein